jgi:hypothetical protein
MEPVYIWDVTATIVALKDLTRKIGSSERRCQLLFSTSHPSPLDSFESIIWRGNFPQNLEAVGVRWKILEIKALADGFMAFSFQLSAFSSQPSAVSVFPFQRTPGL